MYRGSNQVFHRQRNLSNDCFEMGLTWAKVEYYEFLYSLTMFLFVSLWTLVFILLSETVWIFCESGHFGE